MKKRMMFFTAFMIVLNIQTSYAQTLPFNENRDSVVIDFQNHNIRIPNSLKKGDVYFVKIQNVNKNLYNITLVEKDSTISSNVAFPTFNLVGIDGLTQLLSTLKSLTTSATQKPLVITDQNKHGLTPDKIILDLNVKPVAQISDTINKNVLYLDSVLCEINKLNMKIDSLNLEIQIKYLSYFTMNSDITQQSELTKQNYVNKIISESQNIRTEIKTLIKSTKDYSLVYLKFHNRNKPAFNRNKFGKTDSLLNVAYKTTLDTLKAVYSSIDATKVIDWIKSIIYLENNKEAIFYSLPIQLKSDIEKLTINIIPKKPEFGLFSYSTTLQFPQNKTYIGASVSFFVSTMFSDVFSVKTTMVNDTLKNYNIVDEKPAKNEIGIATLIHFGTKICQSDVGIHGSIGPAFAIDKIIKPRMAVGLGFSYGRRQMLTLDFLIIAGFVERKSEAFSADQTYSLFPQQVTVSKLNAGFALSFGYIYKF